MLQVGDIVKIHDASWTLVYEPGDTTPQDGLLLACGPAYQVAWRVLMSGRTFPGQVKHTGEEKQNDTMLCDVLHPERIAFIRAIFCTLISREKVTRPVVHVRVPAGVDVEVRSDGCDVTKVSA